MVSQDLSLAPRKRHPAVWDGLVERVGLWQRNSLAAAWHDDGAHQLAQSSSVLASLRPGLPGLRYSGDAGRGNPHPWRTVSDRARNSACLNALPLGCEVLYRDGDLSRTGLQPIEQVLGRYQIRGVKALAEPGIDAAQKPAGILALALARLWHRQGESRAQLQRLSLLLLRQVQCLMIACFDLDYRDIQPLQQIAL